MSEVDHAFDKIMKSLSGSMIDLAKGPLDAMERIKQGHEVDAALAHSLSINLRGLARYAYTAAAMANLVAQGKAEKA